MSFQRTSDGKVDIVWVVVEEGKFLNALNKRRRKVIKLNTSIIIR